MKDTEELIDNLITEMGGVINQDTPEEGGRHTRKQRDTTQSTKDVYLKNIIRLNNKQEIKTKKNGQPDFDFLKKTNKVLERIGKLKANSQRTYLISIVTTLRGLQQYEEIYDFYYNMMMKLADELRKAPKNNKSDNQQANWIEQDQVIKIYEDLKSQAMPLLAKKKAGEQEWNIILDFIVLSLYVLQSPRRNKDYQLMLYVTNKNILDNPEFNYYLPKPRGKFEFNNYKTAGTYNMQEVAVNPELVNILAKYAKIHPLRKQENFYLLTNYKGEPLIAVNAITRILNRIFGRNIGVSMLRNIYLSDKFKNPMDELNKVARDMGTSANIAQSTYIKMDN